MTKTVIQKSFAPIKKILPSWAYNPIRSLATAFLTPILFAYGTGFARSAFQRKAVCKNGDPLPWYTYPSIDFLKYRNYEDKNVLEFGAGQSTLWWAKRAKHVFALEGDKKWYESIKNGMPDNVELCSVSMASREENVAQVKEALSARKHPKYDVVVIDGLYRYEMIEIALSYLAEDGVLICDNAEGYGFYEGLKDSELLRVDFFGHVPGVILQHSTSVYFTPSSFIFDAKHPIPDIATDT